MKKSLSSKFQLKKKIITKLNPELLNGLKGATGNPCQISRPETCLCMTDPCPVPITKQKAI